MTQVTNSQIKSFKNCRRRYYFEYVQNLRPITTAPALSFGSAYHEGVAAFLRGEDAHEMVEAYANKNPDMDPLQALIAAEAVQAFINSACYDSWEILAIEKEFQVTVDEETEIDGKMDGIIIAAGEKWILEHKTASKVDEHYFHHLLWDDQATNYIMAAKAEHPNIAGVMYVVIQKPKLKMALASDPETRYKLDGELKANCREFDETNDEYMSRIEGWYQEKSRIHIHLVRRNPEQLELNQRELIGVTREIEAAKHLDRFYPNPSACMILSCPFASICLESTPDAIEGLFTIKTKTNEELANDVPAF